MTNGKFIVIDGMDGSGKGTQITLLRERLGEYPVIFTREPGGTSKAEQIRKILLDPHSPSSTPLCDFFLFWASRASHIQDLIVPKLREGISVISDRYDSSTFAFQIYGENHLEWEQIFVDVRNQLRTLIGERYVPDLYIFLDLDENEAYRRRAADQSQDKTRFDIQPLDYHRRVRNGFMTFAQNFGYCRIIDARLPIQEVHAQVWHHVSRQLDI